MGERARTTADADATVVETLTRLMGYVPVEGAPGYSVDPELRDLRAAVREAGRAADIVVVYYTGHGARPERDTYYLVTRKSGAADLVDSALPTGDLTRLLTRWDERGELAAGQPTVLVILDCCYSGSGGTEILSNALRQTGNENTWVIASASDLQYAQQGLFAAAFTDALRRPTTGSSQQFLSLSTFVVLGFAGDAGGPGSCGAVVGSGCVSQAAGVAALRVMWGCSS